MVNPDQPVRTCILNVDIKCCTRCQNTIIQKMQKIHGVGEVEYNENKGVMTVTGDMDPMSLVHRLTKCRRKSEILSVTPKLDNDDDLKSDEEDDTESSSSSDTSSSPDSKPMEFEPLQMKMNQSKPKGYFSKFLGKKRSKPNLNQAMQNINWRVPPRFVNATAPPQFRPGQPHPMHPMQSARPPMMIMTQPMAPPMQYNMMNNMYGPAFKRQQPSTVSAMHYK